MFEHVKVLGTKIAGDQVTELTAIAECRHFRRSLTSTPHDRRRKAAREDML